MRNEVESIGKAEIRTVNIPGSRLSTQSYTLTYCRLQREYLRLSMGIQQRGSQVLRPQSPAQGVEGIGVHELQALKKAELKLRLEPRANRFVNVHI